MDSDRTLRRLKIAIVGLGGGGSHIAQQLAHLGVGQFILIDPDTIEATNLNRLVGATVEDVRQKRPKVVIAARTVRAVRPSAKTAAIQASWQSQAELLRDVDVIFGCVDSFGTRDELERVARRYLVPYIDIGMDVIAVREQLSIVGQVALSLPGFACLRCMNVLQDSAIAREAAAYGNAGPRPQVVWSNAVLAATAVGIMVSIVSRWNEQIPRPILIEYDGNLNELRRTAADSLLRTAQCRHFMAPTDLGDPWFQMPIARFAPRARRSAPSLQKGASTT